MTVLEDRGKIGCEGIEAGSGRKIRREAEVWAQGSSIMANFIETGRTVTLITGVIIGITGVILL